MQPLPASPGEPVRAGPMRPLPAIPGACQWGTGGLTALHGGPGGQFKLSHRLDHPAGPRRPNH